MKSIIAFLLTALAVLAFRSCGKTAGIPEPAVSDAAPAIAEASGAVDEAFAETSSSDAEIPDSAPEGGADAAFSPDFTFETTDRTGNVYDESVFAGHKVTILNFWEPWCGPCVREMPYLEKLYASYSGSGLNVIGVYSTQRMEEDVDSVLESAGVSFPILHYTAVFDAFQTGYVPTTILVDGSGHIVGETVIGSQSYEEWEALIREYLS